MSHPVEQENWDPPRHGPLTEAVARARARNRLRAALLYRLQEALAKLAQLDAEQAADDLAAEEGATE